jgi:hypothetical protein
MVPSAGSIPMNINATIAAAKILFSFISCTPRRPRLSFLLEAI